MRGSQLMCIRPIECPSGLSVMLVLKKASSKFWRHVCIRFMKKTHLLLRIMMFQSVCESTVLRSTRTMGHASLACLWLRPRRKPSRRGSARCCRTSTRQSLAGSKLSCARRTITAEPCPWRCSRGRECVCVCVIRGHGVQSSGDLHTRGCAHLLFPKKIVSCFSSGFHVRVKNDKL